MKLFWKNDFINGYISQFPRINSNMYSLISNQGKALIIDPFVNEEIVELLNNSVEEIIILLTHEHFDHISGVNYYRNIFKANALIKVICNSACAENIELPEKNLSMYWEILTAGLSETEEEESDKYKDLSYSCSADFTFETDYDFEWQGLPVSIKSAPGHSAGGCIIFIGTELVFTGDNLVNGYGVICRWPGGSKKEYLEKTKPMIEAIGEDMLICPGHGNVGCIDEMMQYTEMFKRKAD